MSHAQQAILALLDHRDIGQSICPSEAAKRIATGSDDWRDQMGVVHAAVDALLDEDTIAISWKGEATKKRRGPYRITRR